MCTRLLLNDKNSYSFFFDFTIFAKITKYSEYYMKYQQQLTSVKEKPLLRMRRKFTEPCTARDVVFK